MRVIITAQELIDLDLWETVCVLVGINVWAVNEGLMDADHEFEFDEEDARKLGLI